MNLLNLARATMGSAQETKAHMVHLNGIGEPATPTLVMMNEGKPVAIAYFEWDHNVRALVTVRSLIALIDCDSVALALETFAMAGAEEELEAVDNFAQAFADGDQRVQESLVVYTADRDGHEVLASCPYTYRGRTVQYGKVFLSDVPNQDGTLSATFRSGFAKQATTPTVDPTDVGELLGVTISIPVIGPNN